MPLFFIFALVGFGAIFMWRRARNTTPAPRDLRALRIVMLGTLASGFTVIPYSYIGNRYMSDFIPFLVIAGLVGMQLAIAKLSARRWHRRTLMSFVAVLSMFSLWVNTGLSYAYHSESDLLPEGTVNQFVLDQYKTHQSFPGGAAPYVKTGNTLPYPPFEKGTLFVVGDCQGVYWSQGNTWAPTEKWYAIYRTAAAGYYDLRVKFKPSKTETLEPLVARGLPGHRQIMAAIIKGNDVNIAFKTEGHPELSIIDKQSEGFFARRRDGFLVGPKLKFDPKKTYELAITMDPNNGTVSAIMSGYVGFVFFSYALTTSALQHFVFATDHVELGRNTLDRSTTATFSGMLRTYIAKDAKKLPEICRAIDWPAPKHAQHG